MLMAQSRREAWYSLKLIEIAGGFVIAAKAGCGGRPGREELWFRWRLVDAEKLFSRIFNTKTRAGRKRNYHKASPYSPQLDLFDGG
jgi:hypothetical protein